MRVLGLDIGGAHLKVADADGHACSVPFEIWKSPDRLPSVLRETLKRFSAPDLLAVTMTAELADCFETKADGVCSILSSVEQVAGRIPIAVWQTGAEFVTPEVARTIPLLVAAANWHSLATFVGRLATQNSALLIDVGSTTTDVIPLSQGVPVPHGFTDCERLQAGELVYTGTRRTPVFAVSPDVLLKGRQCPLAAELFATTLDVYLLLGEIEPDPDNLETANGRPATPEGAHDRLARAVCCDRTELSRDQVIEIASQLAVHQQLQLVRAFQQVLAELPSACEQVLLSGSGVFLARKSLTRCERLKAVPVTDLRSYFTPEIAEAACAYALARLAHERISG